MNPESHKITVSTDVLGFMAYPPEVQQLYEQAGFKCNLEVVAMPLQYKYLIGLSRDQRQDFDIGGFHGQLGTGPIKENLKGLLDWFLIKFADFLLPEIMGWADYIPILPFGVRADMASSNLRKPVYINVHDTVVENKFYAFKQYGYESRYSNLTIENSGSRDSIWHTFELIHELHDSGATKTTGTLDLVHALVEFGGKEVDFETTKKYWNKTINCLGPIFKYMHLPIGTNKDSLPIMQLLAEKKMLKDLAAIVTEYDTHIILENQHNLLLGVFSKKKEVTRLKQIRDGLLEAGFKV